MRCPNKIVVFANIAILLSVLSPIKVIGAEPLAALKITHIEEAISKDVASDAPFRLEWDLIRNEFSHRSPGGKALVRFKLTNLDVKSLPKRGWAIYFNMLDSVEIASPGAGLTVEQVSGNLFRLRPTSSFKGLAPGKVTAMNYRMAEKFSKLQQAPTGPYLVFGIAPETGHAIRDFRVAAMNRPLHLDKKSDGRNSTISPQTIFKRNQIISNLPEAGLPQVFPTPLHLEQRQGILHLASMPVINDTHELRAEATFARALLAPYLGSEQNSKATPMLHLAIGEISNQSSPEAYELSIDRSTGITLTGNSAAGVFFGLQTLRDLLPLYPHPDSGVDLPALIIRDAPRFSYRGFQLDVARNFHPKATIFKLLDLMARYKLNKFHFHLTDDEGWRLEIVSIPELTSIGAVRGHTMNPMKHLQPAYGSGPDIHDQSGSGFYSRADFIEILQYAAARHIEVITEIEMPGHARAAVKAMESRYRRLVAAGQVNASEYLISDLSDKSKYRSPQMYTDHVMNPGLESTYVFIERVIGDVVTLYKDAGVPLHTLHVGGDELPNGAWEKSPASLALMTRLKLATTADLWDYFYNRVDQMLQRHGMFASGWEELGARKTTLLTPLGASKLIPNPKFRQSKFNVTVWNNLDGAEDFAYRLANAGYQTILAPVTHLYLDMAYNKNLEEPGANWGGYVDLDTVYNFIPLDYLKNVKIDPKKKLGMEGLTDFGREHILGLEAPLFTETVRDAARLEYMVMPRILGLAERAWASDPAWAKEQDPVQSEALRNAAWSAFVNVLGKRVLPRLDVEHIGVAYRIPPPGLKLENGQVLVNIQLPGLTLRYTTNGTEPDATSSLVSGAISAKGVIHVAAFDRNARRGLSSHIKNP